MRPGVVYRLYSKDLHERFFQFDMSEVQRTPLQETIVQLKAVTERGSDLDKSVVDMLENLIEPPNMSNINKSFEILYDAGMIDDPCDDGRLTPMGRFSSGLSVGIQLSRLISLGVAMGLEEEVCLIKLQPQSSRSLSLSS